MKLTYSEYVDAAYAEVTGPIPSGGVDATERLDQDRTVDRDAAGCIVGYEFLNARRHGVRLDDLEHRADLARAFTEAGIRQRTWSAPLAERRRVRPPSPTG